MLRFLTYVVPLALFQYYPLLYLLALPFTIPAYAFWRYGLSKYKSTGS